jgi:hypothetical protein
VSARSFWAALLLAAALPAPLAAQGLRDRAFVWAQGDFRAPLACVIDGAARQALRRIRVFAAPRGALPSLRVTFYDLEAPPGTSCGGLASHEEPNVIGGLVLTLEGRNQPDTGEIDFRNALKREGGFAFRIESGRLRTGSAGAPVASLASHDYAGGVAHVRAVAPGSDAATRQLELSLEAPGAPALAFDLVELPPH